MHTIGVDKITLFKIT